MITEGYDFCVLNYVHLKRQDWR